MTVASGHDSTFLDFFASELSSSLGRNASCCDFKQLFPQLAGVALHGGTGGVEKNVVDDTYEPNTDPTKILRRNFVGILKLGSNAGGNTGFAALEFDNVVERLSGERLTPNHIYRNLNDQQTGIEISVGRIETDQVRVR